jgi:hypothetical protein
LTKSVGRYAIFRVFEMALGPLLLLDINSHHDTIVLGEKVVCSSFVEEHQVAYAPFQHSLRIFPCANTPYELIDVFNQEYIKISLWPILTVFLTVHP